MTNFSQVAYTSPSVMATKLSLCLVLFLIGTISNGAICLLLIRFKTLRTVSNSLLANLAFVGLLHAFVNIPPFIIYHFHLGPFFNNSTGAWWTTFLLIFLTKLNFISTFVVIVDRFFAMAYTVRYSIWKSQKKALVAVCAAWIIAALLTTYFSSIPVNANDLGTKSVLYYRFVYFASGKQLEKKFNLITMSLLLVVSTVTTIVTLLEIRKIRRIRRTRLSLNKCNNKAGETDVRAACTILMVLFSYNISYLSGIGFVVATATLSVQNEQSNQLFFSAFCSFSISSWCNAVIYTTRSTNFRKAFKKVWERCPCSTRPVTSPGHYLGGKECRAFYVEGALGKQQVVRMYKSKSKRPNILPFAEAKDSHGIQGRKQGTYSLRVLEAMQVKSSQ